MAKTKARYFDYSPDAYISGVAGVLTGEEQGVYWMICSLVMAHGGEVEYDLQRFKSLLLMRPTKIEKVINTLISKEKLKIRKRGKLRFLTQDRAQLEVDKAVERMGAWTRGGENSGKSRQKLGQKSAESRTKLDQKSGVENNENKGLDGSPFGNTNTMNKNSNSETPISEGIVGTLKSATYETARDAAPGFDIYELERRWREWSGDRFVKHPDRAFLGFVRRHAEKNPL